MCDKCRTVPEALPPAPAADMIPAALIADDVNATLVIVALTSLAEDYITTGESFLNDPRTTPAACAVITANMVTVSERVAQMIESISTHSLAVSAPLTNDN